MGRHSGAALLRIHIKRNTAAQASAQFVSPTFAETPGGLRTAAPEVPFPLFGLLIPPRTRRCCIRAGSPMCPDEPLLLSVLNERWSTHCRTALTLVPTAGVQLLTTNGPALIPSPWEELLDLPRSSQQHPLPPQLRRRLFFRFSRDDPQSQLSCVTKPRCGGSWQFPPSPYGGTFGAQRPGCSLKSGK